MIWPLIIWGVWFYLNVIKQLPDISDIENAVFSEASVIVDKNWVELYKLFEENRKYISYDDISDNFVHAIVAIEDQRYWENPWVDWKWTLRSAITNIRSNELRGWWSTITQQVIKNILLTPEKKYTRKFKEIILALKLVNYVRDDISATHQDLSKKEVDRKMKEKILELYSNYIFLWNNTYGIETASNTYFNVSADELTVLQWAILASLPKAPSTYDPYSENRWLLMGEMIIEADTNSLESSIEITEELSAAVMDDMKRKISEATFWSRDDTWVISFLDGLLTTDFEWEGITYQVTYNIWRKDLVLARMYDEKYITEDQLKKALIDWMEFEFWRNSIEIKAPHFVFWVIDELQKKYDQDILRTGWLTITTTLDYEIQKLAEESMEENEGHYDVYQAVNSSLIYLDSHTWDVLAYVWSRDYNNDDIDGQVDMVRAARQPWSIIKPFVYGLWFMNVKLTLDSPIYDVKMKIGSYEPQNADGKFNWLTTLKQALAASRNIPAIKMFMSAGGEQSMKNFLASLWLNGLIMDRDHYGYALSLWAAETPMLEMANAYAHLSATWKPAHINPILEVRASDEALLYSKEIELQEEVVPGWVAYLMWKILSDKTNFPQDWRANFTVPGIEVATKSGTSNIETSTWEKLPRDGWLATYTPSKVLLLRSGNTDGSAMRRDAYGWWLNSPTWKSFMTKLKNQQYIQNESMQETWVKQVSVSKISGKLASVDTPLVFMKQSLWYINSLPTEYDSHISSYEIDTLCDGKPTDLTPEASLGTAWYLRPESIMPNGYDQDDIMTRWRNGWLESFSSENVIYTLSFPEEECEERALIEELWEISLNLMEPKEGQSVTRSFSLWHQTKSPFVVTDMKLSLDDIELTTISYNKETPLVDIQDIVIPDSIEDGTYIFKAEIFDDKWYSDSKSVKITIWSAWDDIVPPYLIKNKVKVTKNDDGTFNVVLLFADDASSLGDSEVSLWWEIVHSFSWNLAAFTTSELWLFTYTVEDTSWNKATWQISLSDPNPSIPEPIPDPEPEVEPTPPVEEVWDTWRTTWDDTITSDWWENQDDKLEVVPVDTWSGTWSEAPWETPTSETTWTTTGAWEDDTSAVENPEWSEEISDPEVPTLPESDSESGTLTGDEIKDVVDELFSTT